MDTLSANGITLQGTAQVNGQSPKQQGIFTTNDLKVGTTFLSQSCSLNSQINVKVTKETTNSQYSTVMEWTEI